MRIVVIGAGVIGETTGRHFATRGHVVEFVDTDPERVRLLRRDGWSASTAIGSLCGEVMVMVCVSTPAGNEGHDLRHLTEAVRHIAGATHGWRGRVSVVIRSTVPPGTCTDVVEPILRTEGNGAVHFRVASNPEFLREAKKDYDFMNPRVVVVGSRDERLSSELMELYSPFGGLKFEFEDPVYAEMSKLVHNMLNATQISFWNEILLICERIGISPEPIAAVVAESSEAAWNSRYGQAGGAPFGGRCLPKDARAFERFARSLGVTPHLVSAVLRINSTMAQRSGPTSRGSTSAGA